MTSPTKVLLLCPFCEKKAVPAFHHPKMRQAKTSRGSGQSSTHWFVSDEHDEILAGCSECGKSKKEVEAALKGEAPTKESAPKCIICDRDIDTSRSLCEECEKKYYKGKTAAGTAEKTEKGRIV
jgi:sarcosine oxidase delta subunit